MSEKNDDSDKGALTSIEYDSNSPLFTKIRMLFLEKLKDKYSCADYEKLVDYLFDLVFKKKFPKEDVIKKTKIIFKEPEYIIDFLYQTAKDTEREFKKQEEKANYNNYKKGGKFSKSKGYYDNRNKKYRKERSRSISDEGRGKKYDYDVYQNYPGQPKGFYPPKGRFGGPMMPMPSYYPPQMMQPPYMR